jgi:flagellar hook-basal body complex protein FliE
MNPLNSLGPIGESKQVQQPATAQMSAQTQGPSFKETLDKFLTDVNQMQVKADESIQKMESGEINDVHQVMNAVEEANVAFNMMMEIRNKVMDAYQEVMRLRL